MGIDFEALLDYSRELQRAQTQAQLLETARAATCGSTRYATVAVGLFEQGADGLAVRMIGAAGTGAANILDCAGPYPVAGDAMLQEILAGRKPVVVVDARTDPRTNKAIVAAQGCRSLLNVPLLLGEEVIGSLAFATYDDEPCVTPTADELAMVTVFALQFAAAAERVRILDRERTSNAERDALKLRLRQVERIETMALVAGGVAHDFNNLLTVIVCTLEMLARADLPGSLRESVRDATDAALRAGELTRQLLAMGRRQTLCPRSIDWRQRLEDVARLLRRVLPEDVHLTLELDPDLPAVMADGPQLDQVVMNLCINARDAMPHGGSLTLRAHAGSLGRDPLHPGVRAGPAVTLEVVDTGQGMPPEVLERIFEPYFTTKPVGGGTGLGLAVAQGIVDQHGGTLECTTAPGQGTTFRVTIPAAGPVGAVASRLAAAGVATGRERVLAADDDPAIRALVHRVLAEAGYAVTVVSDGAAAVEAARATPVDLVLLDAVMPGMSGREALEEIHRLQPDVAWVIMTGHGAASFPAELLERHRVELVEKPWSPSQLLAALRRALDRRGAPAAPRTGAGAR